MNDELPFRGPASSDGNEARYEWLDEWLCEYVDGTMDPSLETVFEQYVEANPELKAHVQRLRKTRELLCSCGLSTETPGERDDSCKQNPVGDPPALQSREGRSGARSFLKRFGLVSTVTVALLIGFLAGMAFTKLNGEQTSPKSPASSSGVSGPTPALQQAGPSARPEAAYGNSLRLQPVGLDSTRQNEDLPARRDLP